MPTLNGRGKEILKAKAQKFKNKNSFSIVFIGDSHIGQTNVHRPKPGKCECGAKCPEQRYMTMLRRIWSKKGVYCIIHGGDGSDFAVPNLKKFRDDTEKILKYSSTGINDAAKIPLLSNIGNHDYKLGKKQGSKVNRNEFTDLIGKDNDIISLVSGNKGPRMAVVLVDTGYGNAGKLPKGEDFKTRLDNLAASMGKLINQHSTIRFIIDMHIPPRIPGELTGTHVLNPTFNYYFRQFLKKHRPRILAVVAHHKHGVVQSTAYHLTFNVQGKKRTIPVYLTAQGGHCDYNTSPNEKPRYSFYKVNLIYSSDHYILNNVQRIDMIKNTSGVYVLDQPVLIKKS